MNLNILVESKLKSQKEIQRVYYIYQVERGDYFTKCFRSIRYFFNNNIVSRQLENVADMKFEMILRWENINFLICISSYFRDCDVNQ